MSFNLTIFVQNESFRVKLVFSFIVIYLKIKFYENKGNLDIQVDSLSVRQYCRSRGTKMILNHKAMQCRKCNPKGFVKGHRRTTVDCCGRGVRIENRNSS